VTVKRLLFEENAERGIASISISLPIRPIGAMALHSTHVRADGGGVDQG
jgi:hypothetical protein